MLRRPRTPLRVRTRGDLSGNETIANRPPIREFRAAHRPSSPSHCVLPSLCVLRALCGSIPSPPPSPRPSPRPPRPRRLLFPPSPSSLYALCALCGSFLRAPCKPHNPRRPRVASRSEACYNRKWIGSAWPARTHRAARHLTRSTPLRHAARATSAPARSPASRRRRPTRAANRSGPTRPTPRDRPHHRREGTITS